jgi:hypothetical protein
MMEEWNNGRMVKSQEESEERRILLKNPTFRHSNIPSNFILYSTLSSFFKQENRSLKRGFGKKERSGSL